MEFRWWTYQKERFPIVAIGPMTAVVGLSAVSYSALLRDKAYSPGALPVLVAAATTFLFFLELRIADEFKDLEEDARYRPYRPVPRGLVSLGELTVLVGVSALAQMGMAFLLRPELALLLGLVWVYLAAMSKEFFVARWLKSRPFVYMASHMIIIPLVIMYATACDWLAAGEGPPRGLAWFLVTSYFTGLVLELGRKIRAPVDEEPGVDTYSSAWGPRRAAGAWLAALALSAGASVIAAEQVGFLLPVAVLLAVLLVVAAWTIGGFLRNATTKVSRQIEAQSGVWTLVVYLGVGVAPLFWRWWMPAGVAAP